MHRALKVLLIAALTLLGLDAAAAPHFSAPPSVRATFRDVSGDTLAVDRSGSAYVANSSLDRVTIINGALPATRTVGVGRTPQSIVASGGGGGVLFFTSNAGDGTVSIGKADGS